MIIKEKFGNITAFDLKGKSIDRLCLEWYETGKRILHKRTEQGIEVVIKSLKENPNLQNGDVLHVGENLVIVVHIMPCTAIVLRPNDMYEMAWVCYEIGNKHLPLYFQNNELLIPFDRPLCNMLEAAGFECQVEEHQLSHPLKTTVSPHPHDSGKSLFSKILQLTTATSNGRQ